jgi:hypothetical protein
MPTMQALLQVEQRVTSQIMSCYVNKPLSRRFLLSLSRMRVRVMKEEAASSSYFGSHVLNQAAPYRRDIGDDISAHWCDSRQK